MHSELSNLCLLFLAIGKVGLYTGLFPGIAVLAFVRGCAFPFCRKRDFHEGDHDVCVPIDRFNPELFAQVRGGQLAAIENRFDTSVLDRATSPPRKERRSA